MTNYHALGIRPLINACATMTKYGGSLMPPEVLQAMREAAGSFVDLAQLQRRVSERIAALTRNEAAYVTSGAAAGIMLSATASVLHHHPDAAMAFPNITELKHEAIVHRSQRNSYDFAVQQTGMKFVEFDPTTSSLEDAINDKTACIFWFEGRLVSQDDDRPSVKRSSPSPTRITSRSLWTPRHSSRPRKTSGASPKWACRWPCSAAARTCAVRNPPV